MTPHPSRKREADSCSRSGLVRKTKVEYGGVGEGSRRAMGLDDAAGGIGWRLARARKERGLTQEELAALVGVSPRSIQGYEAGKVVPYRRLGELANVMNREVGWILQGDADPGLQSEVLERLVTLIEEVSIEARRIRAVAERLEHLLGDGQPAPRGESPSAPGFGARQ
jgi:transcriptional regulator with XRE-family HTH domain